MELSAAAQLHCSSLASGDSSCGDYFSTADYLAQEEEENELVALEWAAIERLPTYRRLRTSLLFDVDHVHDHGQNKVVDVTKLAPLEQHLFVEMLIKHIQNDNLRLLQKIRERLDRVNVDLPCVEVRYKNVCMEAECDVVKGKPLPTLWNSIASTFSGLTKIIHCNRRDTKISILRDVNGVLKPRRLTLLLGPPGCGKTSLLLALAGNVEQSLKVTGEITYNGYRLDEFVPQKTSAYICQYDLHIPEMTVRETIDFSARCQGSGNRAEILTEVIRREKAAGIVPDPVIDTYMKAIAAEGKERSLQTDYILKVLGLNVCADVMVGDALRRGISGGQRKRLTTGEMIVGPLRVLLMDEISSGLDSSTTFQIVTYLQQLVHLTDATALLALLQPPPETFDLFDDLILMAEGKIVYHGPRSHALQFFESCGFRCPKRKGVADFVQEVLSEKDQAQYWAKTHLPYKYISVDEFGEIFKRSYLGKRLEEKLSKPYNKSRCPEGSISFSKYSLGKWQLFKAGMARELLLMKRNSAVYIFKTTQLIIIAFITMTVFIRTQMAEDLEHANLLMGCLFYTLLRLMTNGIAELSFTIARLPAFYKQKSFYLYPAWAYSLPASILKIPFALVESSLWTAVTYYVIGYSPEIQRFFRQFFLLFSLHQASTSLCRLVASIFQTMVAAFTLGTLLLLLILVFGGFVLPRSSMPEWLKWGFWASPMTYGEIAVSGNEFLAPRWQKPSIRNMTIGKNVLVSHGLDFEGNYYWISVGALFGMMMLFDLGFTLALTYMKPPGRPKHIISEEKFTELQARGDNGRRHLNKPIAAGFSESMSEPRKQGRMMLPFEPLTMTFKDVQYYVDTPKEMREHGFSEKKLQLLCDITGAFRPGVLTALMGVSGAGKTTLMDVLSGRKTGGIVQGDIRIGGYPKVQKTFARISGYCEQNDLHSPQITVEESITFSAWLRLSPEIDSKTKAKFVEEVMETIELFNIKDSLVGIPGKYGLSTDQRKRLTIAVELVSNPSIIFMDEPTSGLDARAAAIVMRAVRNVVATGRTMVCTIHQPSIDIFEAFDELILMKRGGRIIYSGMLGHHSKRLIQYFERIPNVPKIKNNYNPATWMLEVTSAAVESELKLDFAEVYKKSTLCRDTQELVRQLSEPLPGSRDLHFPTQFPQSNWGQFKACLWKQNLSYWRSPEYNLTRFMFMIASALFFGVLFWQKGKKIHNEEDVFSIFGSMYVAIIFLGINNCSTILPYVCTERTVLYREKFAGMYSSKAYSFAQVVVEFPYALLQAILYVAITYPMIGYYCSAYKIFWYFYATFCTFLSFVYLGMLLVSLSPNIQAASILSTAAYTLLNLFSGFLIPGSKIPKWWRWCYWICPTSWSLSALLTSQYGDMDRGVLIFGENKSVSQFLDDYYGFKDDHLAYVAIVLMAFPVAFASGFAYYISKLNFQQR